MGDLIYGRACYSGGSARVDNGGRGIHLHGCVWAGVARVSSGRGKMRQTASIGWDRGRQERRREGRTLSGPTHFRPKSEAEMGARA
jgi:hypothetical protein